MDITLGMGMAPEPSHHLDEDGEALTGRLSRRVDSITPGEECDGTMAAHRLDCLGWTRELSATTANEPDARSFLCIE